MFKKCVNTSEPVLPIMSQSLFLLIRANEFFSLVEINFNLLNSYMLTVPDMLIRCIHSFFIRSLAQGQVPKVPYFWTSKDQIVVLVGPK